MVCRKVTWKVEVGYRTGKAVGFATHHHQVINTICGILLGQLFSCFLIEQRYAVSVAPRDTCTAGNRE